jgi:hypothetical protein
LLRVLNWDEADAVLAHELAHFSGGDTQHSKALGPKLVGFAHYQAHMQSGVLTWLMVYPMALFRAACELGFSKDSRNREFAADALAARAVSADAIARALVKIAGYARFRADIQDTLFASTERHESALNIPQRLAQGLRSFVSTEQFSEAMNAGAVPHPFDSHPPMQQRLQQVQSTLQPVQFADVVLAPPSSSWVQLIPEADQIEQQQWQQFESALVDEHDQSLAFRYRPSTDAERAHVLKYFPDVVFACKKNQVLKITCDGIFAPNASVTWDQVDSMTYNDGSFFGADTLALTSGEKTMIGTKKVQVLKFSISAAERPRVKEVLGQYWHRHQVMQVHLSRPTS